MEIFQFPDIEMVYTRRITDPLWGAKVSGKLGGFSYGILSAYDEHPSISRLRPASSTASITAPP
ncbi:MAG: hypothetical protein ABSA30_12640, partial [Candidatus Aminicenantales bacterium]